MAGLTIAAAGIMLQWSFFVPAACYTIILYFGLKFAGLYKKAG